MIWPGHAAGAGDAKRIALMCDTSPGSGAKFAGG
jgi:hypothetical protein